MKIMSIKSVIVAVSSSAIILVLAGAGIIQGASQNSPSYFSEATAQTLEPFFKLPPDQENSIKEIVKNDIGVQNLLATTEYDYSIDVGAHLVSGVTPEEITAWFQNGQKNTNIIRDYVGILRIGYNQSLTFTINVGTRSIEQLVEQPKSNPAIPELTKKDKEKALAAVSNDLVTQTLLSGKEIGSYKVGVWHSSEMVKLGAVVEITFDHPYSIELELPTIDFDKEKYAFPFYSQTSKQFSGEIAKIIVFVNIEQSKVVAIQPFTLA